MVKSFLDILWINAMVLDNMDKFSSVDGKCDNKKEKNGSLDVSSEYVPWGHVIQNKREVKFLYRPRCSKQSVLFLIHINR